MPGCIISKDFLLPIWRSLYQAVFYKKKRSAFKLVELPVEQLQKFILKKYIDYA